jgi:hypothetical protein
VLIVFTGSPDGTCDLLFKQLQDKAFRFNFDIFHEYEVQLTPSYWSVRNPSGLEITSKNVSGAFWWKAFNYFAENDSYIVGEAKYTFREIYNWCRRKVATKGNPPDYHNEFGKVFILSVAQKYFRIPNTFVGWNFALSALSNLSFHLVAKSLTSGLTASDKVLFTSPLNKDQIDTKHPWYLQDLIDAVADVTVFICGSEHFCFSRSRKDLIGFDWRTPSNRSPDVDEWTPRELTLSEEGAIVQFCSVLGVNWGRIDFLEAHGELIFLEYNANGQWVFLDYSNKVGLVSKVLEYLTQAT